VAVEILNGHFVQAPRIVGRRLANDRTAFLIILVAGIDVMPRAKWSCLLSLRHPSLVEFSSDADNLGTPKLIQPPKGHVVGR
jgi:hypothetical protein